MTDDNILSRLVYEFTNKNIEQQKEIQNRALRGKHWSRLLAEESTPYMKQVAYQMTINSLHRRLVDLRIIENLANKFSDVLLEVYEARKKQEGRP